MSHIRPIGPFAQFAESDIFFPVVKRELAGRSKDGFDLAMPGFRGVYRADENGNPVPLGVVGENYTPASMKDLCSSVEQGFLQSGMPTDVLNGAQVTDTVGRDGAFVKRGYLFPQMNAEIAYRGRGRTNGTVLRYQVGVSTSYDGSSSSKVIAGADDGFCLNGLIFKPEEVEKLFIRHTTGSPDRIKRLAEIIAAGVKTFMRERGVWQQWAEKEISLQDAQETLEKMPGMSALRSRQMLTRVEQEFADRGANVFAFVSALTFYSSHNSDEFAVRQTGNDNVAETLARRDDDVRRWLKSEPFARLAA